MDLPFPAEDLARLYRFALLMAGDAATAEQVLYDACLGCADRIGGYRNQDSSYACILESIRARAKSAPAPESPSAPPLARAFSALPEPERFALAMLYTGLLPSRQIATVMKISLEQMARLLKSARERLEKSGFADGPAAAMEGAVS